MSKRKLSKSKRPKKNKYNATEVVVDGVKFDSKAEAARYLRLKSELDRGLISDLVLQPKFVLMPKFRYEGKAIREMAYVADFQYMRDGVTVVEDVKGMKTAEYKIKAKLFIHQYAALNGWQFREILT
jgi:predicted component of type VI protein secretion system